MRTQGGNWVNSDSTGVFRRALPVSISEILLSGATARNASNWNIAWFPIIGSQSSVQNGEITYYTYVYNKGSLGGASVPLFWVVFGKP